MSTLLNIIMHFIIYTHNSRLTIFCHKISHSSCHHQRCTFDQLAAACVVFLHLLPIPIRMPQTLKRRIKQRTHTPANAAPNEIQTRSFANTLTAAAGSNKPWKLPPEMTIWRNCMMLPASRKNTTIHRAILHFLRFKILRPFGEATNIRAIFVLFSWGNTPANKNTKIISSYKHHKSLFWYLALSNASNRFNFPANSFAPKGETTWMVFRPASWLHCESPFPQSGCKSHLWFQGYKILSI